MSIESAEATASLPLSRIRDNCDYAVYRIMPSRLRRSAPPSSKQLARALMRSA